MAIGILLLGVAFILFLAAPPRVGPTPTPPIAAPVSPPPALSTASPSLTPPGLAIPSPIPPPAPSTPPPTQGGAVVAALLSPQLSSQVDGLELPFTGAESQEAGLDYSTWVFIPYPGNPVLDTDDWDWHHIGDPFPVFYGGTWYMYYEGGPGKPWFYSIGRATAPSPYGPWTKDPNNPVLPGGELNSWEGEYVCCPRLMQLPDGTWVMFYNGLSKNDVYGVGLAYAQTPAGPWEKYKGNPVAVNVYRLNDVIFRDGVYYMLAGPMSGFHLYTAGAPEGPWKDEGAVLTLQENRWNLENFFELGNVFYKGGRYHWFFNTVIGTSGIPGYSQVVNYAWSEDLRHWERGAITPILTPSLIPGEYDSGWYAGPSAMPWEGKLLLWALSLNRENNRGPVSLFVGFPPGIGGSISGTVLSREKLEPGASTPLGRNFRENKSIRLERVTRFALTFRGRFDPRAKEGARVKLFSSPDGVSYDTVPWASFDVPPGDRVVQQTVNLRTDVLFLKVVVENLSRDYPLVDISIIATVGR